MATKTRKSSSKTKTEPVVQRSPEAVSTESPIQYAPPESDRAREHAKDPNRPPLPVTNPSADYPKIRDAVAGSLGADLDEALTKQAVAVGLKPKELAKVYIAYVATRPEVAQDAINKTSR